MSISVCADHLCVSKENGILWNQECENTEQQNMEHQQNSRTPQNSGGTTEYYPEHQRNTPEYQWNTNVAPVEHPQNNGTIQNEFKQTS